MSEPRSDDCSIGYNPKSTSKEKGRKQSGNRTSSNGVAYNPSGSRSKSPDSARQYSSTTSDNPTDNSSYNYKYNYDAFFPNKNETASVSIKSSNRSEHSATRDARSKKRKHEITTISYPDNRDEKPDIDYTKTPYIPKKQKKVERPDTAKHRNSQDYNVNKSQKRKKYKESGKIQTDPILIILWIATTVSLITASLKLDYLSSGFILTLIGVLAAIVCTVSYKGDRYMLMFFLGIGGIIASAVCLIFAGSAIPLLFSIAFFAISLIGAVRYGP